MKLLISALLVFQMACGYGGRHQKDTQQCQFLGNFSGSKIYWFVRPNNEMFAMVFDNPPAMRTGQKYKTITYFDDNADMVHFVKATLDNSPDNP